MMRDPWLLNPLEAVIYVNPRNPYLSVDELFEMRPEGMGKYDFHERLNRLVQRHHVGKRGGHLYLGPQSLNARLIAWRNGDPRNPVALDFVCNAIAELRADLGPTAGISRDRLVARGQGNDIPPHDIEVAITVLARGQLPFLREMDGLVKPSVSRVAHTSWSDRFQAGEMPKDFEALRERIRDLIARRADDRPISRNAIQAFGERLEVLGQVRLRAWWVQMAGELERASNMGQPTMVLVSCVALVEAALTFLARPAQEHELSMPKTRLNDSPRLWRVPDLLKDARRGESPIIKSEELVNSLKRLNNFRQRVHVGMLIQAYEQGPIPDIRAEEPEWARLTLQLFLRGVLDWMEENPGVLVPRD